MGVRVVTDSSAVMPRAWVEKYPIHVVPVGLAWPDGEMSSGDVAYSEVAERLAGAPRPPTTAAPSPGAYEELLEDLLAGGDEVLVVCPSSKLSTTYGNAVLAARSADEHRVRVLDAPTAAAGQGIVVVESAEVGGGRRDLGNVTDHARRVSGRVQIWATLARLDFLRRSGRVPAVAAIGAGALRIQPVIRYASGSPSPVAVSRSSRRAFERILRAWERSIVPGARLRFVAFHSERQDEASEACRRVRERASDADAHVVEVAASLAAHTGPGLLGLAWYWDPLH